MSVNERSPELQARIVRTGLFFAYVVLTLFASSTGFILWRWYTR